MRVNCHLIIVNMLTTLTVMPDLQLRTSSTPSSTPTPLLTLLWRSKDGMIPFLSIKLLKQAPHIINEVFAKPTNSGLLLYYMYHSHVNHRYFTEEWEQLKSVFYRLRYPQHLVDSTVNSGALTSLHCGLKLRQNTLLGSLYPLKTRSLPIL